MIKEVWKDIEDFEGIYQISNLGNVKSLSRSRYNKDGVLRHYKERILKQKHNRANGYNFVILYKECSCKTLTIHRLVATAFLDKFNFNVVNHIDGNKLNNNVNNLEWCDTSHNHKHAIRTGLRDVISLKGSENPFSKLTEDDVIEIKLLLKENRLTQREIGSIFNVYHTTISKIKNGTSWKHVKV